MSAVTTKLSDAERTRYYECKDTIRENLIACFDVGAALLEIRDSKLYREDFDTFEEFAQKTYKIGQSSAYRLIEASEVRSALPPEHAEKLTNESQARALSKVPKEQRSAVMDKAATNGKVTAKTIEKAAQVPVELDKTGFPIPAKLLPLWQRGSEVQQALTVISRLRTALSDAKERDDLLWRTVVGKNHNAQAALDKLYDSVKHALPYAVCPVCQGRLMDKCAACQERGFVSEFFYKNCLDSDSKKVRESVCKK